MRLFRYNVVFVDHTAYSVEAPNKYVALYLAEIALNRKLISVRRCINHK